MARRGLIVLRAVAAVALVAILSACELRAHVHVTVEADGSGSVEVAVGVDDDTAALRPDLLDDLQVDHLVDAGWVVTGPVPVDGFHWVRAEHDFDDAADVEALVDEIAGDAGPFRDFRVTRATSFASESTTFTGTVDFTRLGGSEVAGDVIESSDVSDTPAGELIAELGDRFGAALDEIVQIEVAVRLPGDVESNAPTKATNGAVWKPSITTDGPLTLEATGTSSRVGRVAVVVVGVVVAVAAVLFASVRLALWRRSTPG